jgi:hypothetical protein
MGLWAPVVPEFTANWDESKGRRVAGSIPAELELSIPSLTSESQACNEAV